MRLRFGMINKKNLYLFFCLVLFAVFFMSCKLPNPLYGSWSDVKGENQITFIQDGSCTVKMKTVNSGTSMSGTYRIIQNTVIFELPSIKVNSEFDVRGNVLSITWTYADRTTRNFTMYKIRN